MNEDQQYYKLFQIKALIEFSQEIESMKQKVTHPLLDNGYSVVDTSYYMQEGNTMQSQSPKGTRVSQNPAKFVEELSCMTADINIARQYLSDEEQVALAVLSSMESDKIPAHVQILIDSALWKLYHYANRYYLTEEEYV